MEVKAKAWLLTEAAGAAWREISPQSIARLVGWRAALRELRRGCGAHGAGRRLRS